MLIKTKIYVVKQCYMLRGQARLGSAINNSLNMCVIANRA